MNVRSVCNVLLLLYVLHIVIILKDVVYLSIYLYFCLSVYVSICLSNSIYLPGTQSTITEATTVPLYQPWMMDDDECGAISGMLGKAN
jgi:hypothetical protein